MSNGLNVQSDTFLVVKHQYGSASYTLNDICDTIAAAYPRDVRGTYLTHENRTNVTCVIPALCKAEDEIATLKAELAAANERLAVYEQERKAKEEEHKAKEERDKKTNTESYLKNKSFLMHMRSMMF